MSQKSEEYQKILMEVREGLSFEEIPQRSLSEILESEEYLSFRRSNPEKDLDCFLDLTERDEDPRLFSLDRYLPGSHELKYSDQDLTDFAGRMVLSYEAMKLSDPDAVIFPLRGAEIFKLSFERIADARGERGSLPAPILLPLGPHGSPCVREQIRRGMFREGGKKSIDESISAFPRYEKRAIVETIIERHSREINLDKVLLIDEVSSGGSILRTLNFISRLLPDRPSLLGYGCREVQYRRSSARSDSLIGGMDVLAVEYSRSSEGRMERDSLNRLVPPKRGKSYQSKRRKGDISSVMLTPPLVLDKQHYLPLLIKEDGGGYEIKSYTSERRAAGILDAVSGIAERERRAPLEQDPCLSLSPAMLNGSALL